MNSSFHTNDYEEKDERLSRQPDESPFAYHKRLVYGKLVDKTLSDVDYTELAPLLYGREYASDVARRLMYGSRKTLELMEQEKEEQSPSHDLDVRMIELQKEKQKFFDQRREFKKLINSEARAEHLESMLAEAAENLGNTIGFVFNAPVSQDIGTNEAVLVLSDLHYGMVTDNVFNIYNTGICINRVKRVVDSALKRCALHDVHKLHLFLLGDMIHGAIHVSTRVAAEELVTDQIMQVAEVLAQAVARLAEYVPEVAVYSTYGNHGRVIPKKEESIHRDNMERLIPWWLEHRLNGLGNVEVIPVGADEFILTKVAGHGVCGVHGDLDNVKSSPRLLQTLLFKQYGMNLEYIILGDKHHRESFEEMGITSMICGSLCGADDYASNKRLYSTPSQLLLIFNEAGLDAEYRISCE